MSDLAIILLGFPLGAVFGYLIGHYFGYSRAAAEFETRFNDYRAEVDHMQEYLRQPHA
jgi:hypothetical protein